MNYLQWLTSETQTKYWGDSAIPSEIDASIKNGATGVTTNPVLAYKSFQAVPEFWQSEVDKVPQALSPEERAEELLRIVVQYAANKFKKVFDETAGQDGYALAQLNPTICNDSELMISQALRYAAWGDNISVKTPSIMSALPLVEELASKGVAICTTLNFSVAQAVAVGDAYERGCKKAKENGVVPKPIFVVQQGGRLDEYLLECVKDNRIDIDPKYIAYAGNAVCKKVYSIFQKRGLNARVMPAGLRKVEHLTSMAGAEMTFSLQTRVQNMVLEADPERVCRIDEEIPSDAIKELHKIPEFVKAYEEDAMKPQDFITFGVTQKTLSQFLWTGWAPLETYQSEAKSARWF